MMPLLQLHTETWNTLKSKYHVFLLYTLLLAIPSILFILIQYILVDVNPDTNSIILNSKNALIGIITNITLSIITLWISFAIILSSVQSKTIPNTTAAVIAQLRTSRPLLLKGILLNIVLITIIGISFLLLIIPGFIASIWLIFSYHTYVLEHTSMFASFKRSKQIVTGNFWYVFVRLAIIGAISSILYFTITLVPTIILPLLQLESFIRYINIIASAVSAVYIIVSVTIFYQSMLQKIARTPQQT
jgi:hypothetical protein